MVFKCKMCGGDIEVIEGTNTGKCLYCKSVMTLPISDDERIINLYNRANNLRLDNEFDKAYSIYESILELDESQVEAHWGLVLCRYGVEYVDDPKSKKKVPTCHRTIDSSILTDKDYKYIIKNAYGEALELYKKEAEQISDIQKGILKISANEKPYDVFICYKETDEAGERTHDSVMAEDIYEALVKDGYKVFFARITLEDKLGKEYEPYIYSALKSSKVMLVVGTSLENLEAVWVKNEWSRYLEFMKKDKSKTLIPVYSKIDAYKLPEEFAMLQAQNMDKIGAMQDLVRGIKKLIDDNKNTKNVSDDVYTQVKQMLDEEDIVGNEKMSSTTILKEKTGFLFIAISFVLSFLMLMWMIAYILNGNNGSFNLIGGFNFYVYFHLLKIFDYVASINIIIGLNTLLAFFMGFVNRRAHFISKIQYLLNFVLQTISLNIIFAYGFKVDFGFYIFYILNLLLIVLRPKWVLSSTKLMLNKKSKEKQEIKNKRIKEHYVEIDRSLKMRICALVGVICIVIAILLNTRKLPSFSNERDKSVDQIKIVDNGYRGENDSSNSFSSRTITQTYGDRLDDDRLDDEKESEVVSMDSRGYRLFDDVLEKSVVTYVRYDDIYDVIELEANDYDLYAKVKTATGLVGYLFVGQCTGISNKVNSNDVIPGCYSLGYSDVIEYLPKEK